MRYRVFNEVPSHWELCAVEDVCEINPSQIGPDYPYSVIEYIDISSVSPRRLESVQVLPLKAAPSRAKRIVQDGDTIISTVRPNRRSFLYIKGAKPNTVVSTGFAVIRPRDIDSRYAHYVLTSDPFIEHLTANATGSAYPAVSPEIIAKTLIPLPPKDEQKRIGEILGTFDDKIELNHRMNQTLEAIARAIFKSWFVDFEPFRDGEFVDSDLGPIPKGWEVVRITEIAKVTSGKRPPVIHEVPLSEPPVPVYGGAGPMGYTLEPLFEEPIIVTGRVGTIGRVHRVSKHAWPSDNTLVLLVNSLIYYDLLFFSLQRLDLGSLNRGTSNPLITQEDLRQFQILLPSRKELQRFQSVCSAIFDQYDLNERECEVLAYIRDTLLTKLLVGQVRLKAVRRSGDT